MKKMSLEGLEGQNLEYAKNFNDMVDAVKAAQDTTALDTLKSELKALKEKENPDHTAKLAELETALKEQGRVLAEKKIEPKSEEYKRVAIAIREEIELSGIKSLKELTKHGKFEVEFKADTVLTQGANTGTVGRTNLDANPVFPAVRKLAFIPALKKVTEDSGKAIFGYTEASYTSNAGYVGENAAPANSDTASAVEKFRAYAKISAFLHITTETFEDIPAFANALAAKLEEGAMLFLDSEIYTGNGVDITHPDHIYGISGVATAFDAATFAGTVAKPTIADLIAAIDVQVRLTNGNYMADTVWMNPLDVFKLASSKDNAGQAIINRDFFGNAVGLGGKTLIQSTAITANTMLVADSNVIELRTKRAMTMKMGQVMTGDVENDRQSAILFARMQVLIRDIDKIAVVKVDDISVALGAIEAPEVAAGEPVV